MYHTCTCVDHIRIRQVNAMQRQRTVKPSYVNHQAGIGIGGLKGIYMPNTTGCLKC